MYNEKVMMIKQHIKKELKKVLTGMGIGEIEPRVEFSQDSAHGDYSSNVAMNVFGKQKAKSKKQKEFNSPVELAEEIAEELRRKIEELGYFEEVVVVKPGFINFFLEDKFLIQKLQKSSMSDIDNKSREKKGRVVVEYSSPNIAKPFTIGHLRSTIIGDAVANLLEATGYEVIRDNHVGDWGTQFGKLIYAVKEWGDEAKIASSEHPVKMLVDLYVKFHSQAEADPILDEKARAWFKKLEDRDTEARDLWQKCIDWSWKEFDDIYEKLGVPSGKMIWGEEIEFENNGRGYGESFFEDKMQDVVDELEEKGFLKVGNEGARVVEFDESTKLPPLMIVKKDGATLYATRDLATDKFRIKKYGADITIINEVGAEQEMYFRQLYKLEEMLGWFGKSQRVNLKHGLIRFADGKMSTRKGNTIWLEDVLEEAFVRAKGLTSYKGKIQSDVLAAKHPVGVVSHGLRKAENVPSPKEVDEIQNDIASIVGIGAIKWNDLKRSPVQEIAFDWDEILNMQGNSGPYIQYVFARTQSVLTKVGIKNYELRNKNYELKEEERELLRHLTRFDEVVLEAAEKLAPNTLCTYLFELAQAFNLFYQKHQIINAESDESREFRLFLTEKTGMILKKGLRLLGIDAPVKM